MPTSVADLFVVLDSVTDPFSAGMKKAAADAEAQSHRMSSALGLVTKVGLGVGIAVGGIAAASVKAASDFQANMTKLSTAAGAPRAAVQAATGEILKMGTQVGMTGTQMAEALYHPVSAGLDMATSLQVVKYAAEEAQISGANLDDTTYSLSSVMKAFNYPATQAANTMAMLNAVVGDGDMRFQDFNVSIKNWAPTAAQMGISIQSMGAGLAYLTDRGNSAEEASTRLTMGLSMMATPSKQAAALLEGLGVASGDVKGSTDAMTAVLQKAGITQNQLAVDLSKPDGLYVALKHLQDALHESGVKGTEADSAIAKVFGGGRSDKAILSLLQNLDGLKQKYDQIGLDATPQKFQDNWETTKNTFAFQMQQMKVGAENLGIELGTKLLPVLSNVIAQGESALGQVVSGYTGAASKPVAHENLHNAMLNREAATPPPLTGWQQFGQKIHTIWSEALGDIEDGAKRLEPVGADFVRFGDDVWQSLGKIEHVAGPVAHDLAVGLFGGAQLAGKALANILGPAIRGVADFIDQHQTAIRIFADVVLGGLALKMGVLGTINAAKGVIGLATAILQFPANQLGQISTAFGELKSTASGALDKVLPDSAKLAGLAQIGKDLGSVEKAAKDTSGLADVASAETNIATQAESAEKSVGRFSGAMGKLTLAGGMGAVLFGIGMGADALGKFFGVGDHTAQNMQQLTEQLQLAATGASSARDAFTQTAAQMVVAQTAMGHFGKQAQGMADVDSAMANLVAGGHVQEAKAQFQDIAAALAKQGVDAKTTAAAFPQYEQALKDAGSAAKTADGQVQGLTGALNQQQSLDQFASDLNNVTAALGANGRSLLGNTDGAIANRQAFQQAAADIETYYTQQRNAGVPIDQATADLQKQVDALESTGIQAGLTKGDVDQYLKTLGLIPSSIGTTIVLQTGAAYQQLNGLIQSIDSSVGYVQITGVGGGRAYTNADGGPVRKGQLSWVGERGPELVVFPQDGFVVSNETLTGRAAFDPRLLSRLGAGTGSAGYVPGFGSGGTTVVNYNITQQVQGSVLGRVELENLVRELVQQHKLRNSTTGMN